MAMNVNECPPVELLERNLLKRGDGSYSIGYLAKIRLSNSYRVIPFAKSLRQVISSDSAFSEPKPVYSFACEEKFVFPTVAPFSR